MKTIFCFLFASVLFLHACNEASPPETININDSIEATLLLFQKEHKIELRDKYNPEITLLSTSISSESLELPIGKYDSLKFDDELLWIKKIKGIEQFKISEFIIFPNDARIDGSFSPCFACPHFITEQYAELELIIADYPIQK